MIREGEILGEVRDYEGGLLELSVAEYDGVILYQTGTLQVLGEADDSLMERLSIPMMSGKSEL